MVAQDELLNWLLSKGLSQEQGRVAYLICHGLSNEEIAKRSGKRVKTVKVYSTPIFQRMGVRTRCELIVMAWREVPTYMADKERKAPPSPRRPALGVSLSPIFADAPENLPAGSSEVFP